MNEKDIQIVMDTKIVQQILKTIPENMHNQINIIMVNQVGMGDGKGDFQFLEFLRELPAPRMKSLKSKAIEVSFRIFKHKKEVADFLGIDVANLMPSRYGRGIQKVEEIE